MGSRGLVCHTYCCYKRNRYGRRSYNSYCWVFEYGRQVLKQCARRYTSVSEAEDDDDAESEGGFETFTWFVAGTTAGCIAMVGAVFAWSKLQKRTVREQPLLA